LDGEDEFGILH